MPTSTNVQEVEAAGGKAESGGGMTLGTGPMGHLAPNTHIL